MKNALADKGERTFGKGTVQNLIDLGGRDPSPEEKLGQLKVTIAQFFRVNGDSTQHWGLVPDITFPTALGVIEEGERAFASVRGRHEKRVKNDLGFNALLEEVQLAKEADRKTSISLLESKRSQEMQASKTSQREREVRIQRALGLAPEGENEGAVDGELEIDLSKDVLLREAAYILGDLILKPKFKASRQPPGRSRYGRRSLGLAGTSAVESLRSKGAFDGSGAKRAPEGARSPVRRLHGRAAGWHPEC